jgi:kumamolisin
MATNSIAGSERQPLPGAKATGNADPSEVLEITVLLRRGNSAELRSRAAKLAIPDGGGEHLSREQFEQRFGASAADIATLKKFAAEKGLSVTGEYPARRTIMLSGTVAKFNAAFGVNLQTFKYAEGSYRGRVGAVGLPDELRGSVEAVLGLDNRPAAKPHFRKRPPVAGQRSTGVAGPVSFTPPQIATLYDFPTGTGRGECVAIIELGGGERGVDLTAYFAKLGIALPKVTAVSVDHAQNKPTGDPNGPDGEVMLDIEVVGAIAPDANIVVYFAPNTDAGFLDAITTAIHDAKNKPSIISISWGGPESSWTQQATDAFDSAFQAAATMGITVCVASGDNGSTDGVNDGADHVDFPASSPHALACGGTTLRVANGSIGGETVWNDLATQEGSGGGGISSVFPLPAWQGGLSAARTAGGVTSLAMRGVPDVSGDADPETGYVVRIDGADTVIGGTSAVAPLWAGLIARLNSANGVPVGFINPKLYASPTALRDITEGNNGSFSASAGWDACTGLGSPNGSRVAALIGSNAATS